MRHLNKTNFIGLLLLSFFLFAGISTFAQTRRRAAPAPSSKTVAVNQPKQENKCDGGYSGSITYTRTTIDNWTGKFGSSRTKKKVFQTTILVRDDGNQRGTATMSPDGKISGSFNFKTRAAATLSDNDVIVQNNESDRICSFNIKGAKDKKHEKCSATTSFQSQATGEGEVTVYMRLNGDKLYLSSDVPRVTGQTNETSNSSCSGGCTNAAPINSSRTMPINNEKQPSFYTDENAVTFNPQSFNRLSGSFTRASADGKTVETITWNLSRCAPPLRVERIAFEHRRFPNPTAWRGVDPSGGTVDGNIVKVKAKIFNAGGDTAYASVKFSETTSGVLLPNGTISAAIKPGEARDVEYEWDTSGFAWDENQRAKMGREIKVELDADSLSEKIKIIPKPVILVHGLWSNAAAWGEYPIYLRNAHSYDWKAFAVGADPEHGLMNTGNTLGNNEPTNSIFENARELGKQIQFTQESINAWHVDIVAHSMGGLISRFYIHHLMKESPDGKPVVTHLAMLGTPNMGSPWADIMFEEYKEKGWHVEALRELKTDVCRTFNSQVTNRKGVKFSITYTDKIPLTGNTAEAGDGVVSKSSAIWQITDVSHSDSSDHTALTGKEDFVRFILPRLALGPKRARGER